MGHAILQNIQKEFPALRNCIYANTAASGLLSHSLLRWRAQHDLDYLHGGGAMKLSAMQNLLPEVRNTVGRFFQCKRENVALLPNFSLGMNMLLEGLDGKHHVALLENDYPSVNWPFENRGFRISYLENDGDLEQNLWKLLQSGNITVLALSLVQWLDGFYISLDFIKKVKEIFPKLLIIADGTQFCGMYKFNFEASGIDILGASGYKWLLSGYGNGFMLFKENAKDYFSVKTIGFNGANGKEANRHNMRFSKHFEPGHLDTLSFGSLMCSLDFLDTIGMETISEYNIKLSKKAKEVFGALGLLQPFVTNRDIHSTIFNIKGDTSMYNFLSKNSVICAQRGDGIRLGFTFYNTENDIDTIAEIVKTFRG